VDAVLVSPEVLADVASCVVPEYLTDQSGMKEHHADDPDEHKRDQHDE
jgi:hypothetical protein